MKRWVFNLLAGASLVLCVLTAGLWVRSYSVMDAVRYNRKGSFAQISGDSGRFAVSWGFGGWPGNTARWYYDRYRRPDVETGFGPADSSAGPIELWDWGLCREVTISYWVLVLLFSLAPAAWLSRGPLLRRRRVRLGLCRHCGYDLRATPGRCPECGRENAPSPLAADPPPPGPPRA